MYRGGQCVCEVLTVYPCLPILRKQHKTHKYEQRVQQQQTLQMVSFHYTTLQATRTSLFPFFILQTKRPSADTCNKTLLCPLLSLLLIHPPRLTRPLRRAPLHLLMREPPPIRARLRIVALAVPLLPAKAKLVVLLLALEVAAVAAAAAALGLVRLVERDVEEVFFVGGGYVGAGAF